MAYLLRFNGSTDHVVLPDIVGGASEFEISFDWAPTSLSAGYGIVFGNNNGSSATRNAVYQRSNGEMEVAFIIGGSRRKIDTSGAGLSVGTRKTLLITYNGSTLVVKIDGSTVGSMSASGNESSGSGGIDDIGRNISTYADIDLYAMDIEATVSGTQTVVTYDPSATGGTGTVLEDTTGSNDGTLTNFSGTINSWWESYDDGGSISASVAQTITKPVFSVSSSFVAPVTISADIAYTIAKPIFATSASKVVPTFTSN